MDEDNSDALTKRKKNADAQAAFRARRQSYIKSLEQTVLDLKEGVTEIQKICKSATSEAKQMRERCASLQNAVEDLTRRLEKAAPSLHGGGPCPVCRHSAPSAPNVQASVLVDYETWATQTGRIPASAHPSADLHPPPVVPEPNPYTDHYAEPSQPHENGIHASTSATSLDHYPLGSTSTADRFAGSAEGEPFAGAPFELAALGRLMHPDRPFHAMFQGGILGALDTISTEQELPYHSATDLSAFIPRQWPIHTSDYIVPPPSTVNTYHTPDSAYLQEVGMQPVPSSSRYPQDPVVVGEFEATQDRHSRSQSNKRSWVLHDSHDGGGPESASSQPFGTADSMHQTPHTIPDEHLSVRVESTIQPGRSENGEVDVAPSQVMIRHIQSSMDRRRTSRSDRLAVSDPIAACSSSGSSKVNGLPAKVARCQRALVDVQDALTSVKEEGYQELPQPPDYESPVKRSRSDVNQA